MTANEQLNKNNFVRGALVLSIGGFIAKILGAIYRIPLSNILGSYGMGVYQLVFPLYALLLAISSAGIPSAISKLISEKLTLNKQDEAHGVFKNALILLIILGTVGSVLLFLFADKIAAVQGNTDTVLAYKIISPSVLIVCIISAFRGYFQGRLNMAPTAISQIIEQAIKLGLGLGLIFIFKADVLTAVYLAVLAVTVSEVIAVVVLAVQYMRARDKSVIYTNIAFSKVAKEIFKLAIPITLCGAILPLTQLIDSALVINLIKLDATKLYGLYSGPVHSLINLPVVLSLGVATAAIPSISRSNISNDININDKINSAFKLTMLLALPSTVGLIMFSMPIVKLLYASLPLAELELASRLLQVSAVSVLLLSIVQTSTAVLQARNKLFVPLIILGVATIIKIVSNIILLPISNINIFGCAIATVICYMVAAIADLMYITIKGKVRLDIVKVFIKPFVATFVMSIAILIINGLGLANTSIGTIISLALAVVVYLIAVILFKVIDESEQTMIKNIIRKKKDVK